MVSPDAAALRTLVAVVLASSAGCYFDRESSSGAFFVDTAPTLNAELEFDGGASEVAISPDGRIWLATGVGQVVVGDSVLAPWSHRLFPPIREDWGDYLSAPLRPAVSLLAFFTPDTLIAMGLGDQLLRTVDGGATWDTVRFAIGTSRDVSFTDAAYAFPTGRAWLGGGAFMDSTSLFVTSDYGASWDTVPPPWESRISSIYMEDDSSGLVGGLWNHLASTHNGGLTWSQIPTPYDQGVVPDVPGERPRDLEAVTLFSDRMVVRQGNRVFSSPISTVDWTILPNDVRMFAHDRDAGRLYGLTSAGEVLDFDQELRPTTLGARAHGVPVHMSARAGKIVVLEREGALLEIVGSRIQYGFPLSDRPSSRMRKARLDGDRVWAVSSHHIYTSTDLGETWDRVGFTPTTIRSFLVRGDGDLLLWDGHGRNVVYEPETGILRPDDALAGYDIVNVLQAGSTWIAFGGRQYETTGRVEVGRTYHAGQFEGSRENGFVLLSSNAGRSWRQIDEWEGGGVANVFFDQTTRDLVLVSHLGGIRRLDARSGYEGGDLILPTRQTWETVPYVEVPSVIYFSDSDRGFIDGWTHHIGERRYSTSDGGRTWQQERPVADHEILSVPTSSGYLTVGGSEIEGGLEIWLRQGTSQTSVWRPDVPALPPDEYPWGGITDISVDERGRVLVLVDGTEIVLLPTIERG